MAKRKDLGTPRKNSKFWDSAIDNKLAAEQYYNRLTELSIAMFEWKNMPDTIDVRFLEISLFTTGMAVFFRDNVIGYLALKTRIGAPLNVYNIPMVRTAYANNGYQKNLTDEDSVIIYNNMLHQNSIENIWYYAKRLAELDRTIDVNAKAQKTPVLISCSESQRLTMKNLYMQYDGNQPFIFGDDNLRPDALRVLKTDAPYLADKLYSLKTQLWNEALTYLGISNVNIQKKERMITDEVMRNQGGTIASRYSRLESRREACKMINRMFGLNIWCDYREDYQEIDVGENDTVNGEPNSDGEGGEVSE